MISAVLAISEVFTISVALEVLEEAAYIYSTLIPAADTAETSSCR